jgi:hypothetical protein
LDAGLGNHHFDVEGLFAPQATAAGPGGGGWADTTIPPSFILRSYTRPRCR